MKKIRLLIADDHSIVRNGLRTLFMSHEEFSVVAEASSGEEAVSLAKKLRPDVAIIDISMPNMSGIEVTRILKQKEPEIKVLILTIHDNEEYIYQMVREGANGYVLKNAEKEEIFAAVRAAYKGERFFSPTVSNLIIESMAKRGAQGAESQEPKDTDLSKREMEILAHVANGLTSREIADKLFLSVSTVNTHRTNIMKKLNIHDTASLVRYAIQNGLTKAGT